MRIFQVKFILGVLKEKEAVCIWKAKFEVQQGV